MTIDAVVQEVVDATITAITEEATLGEEEEAGDSATMIDEAEVVVTEVEEGVVDEVEEEEAEVDEYSKDSVRLVVVVQRRKILSPSRNERESSPLGTSSLLVSIIIRSNKLK